jgi:nicotinamidase-related amidase/alkylated DNA repair dioxygenase AlkB
MNELVIMIDLQNDFADIMNDKFTNSINKLCKYLKLTKKEMLFIKSHYFEVQLDKININSFIIDRLEGTHQGKKICIKNTFGSELINLVKSYSNDSNTIIKHYYSGFKETNLQEYLEKNNIDTLIFCGLTINTCVKATILDGLRLGYNVKIIKECVIGINDKMTIKGLEELKLFNGIQIFNLNTYTNGFEIYCSGDTFILNDVFPSNIYNDETFANLIDECDWKQMEIQGGQLSRLVDVQAIIDESNEHLIPVYRNPSDKYIEPHELTPTIQKMFDWLNSQIDLDGIKFNHVFLKYYKSCSDGIGKHSDKTLDLNKFSYIGNLSLGSTRKMTFRSKITSEIINVTLKSNSILFIGMETNKKWLHEVKPDLRSNSLKTPDELAFQTQRMSLTFRTACTYFNIETNKLEGQGAPKIYIDPNDCEKIEADKDNLIKAFGQENKLADFDWIEFYSSGFYSLCTK